jgi:hypothetical protein
MQIILQKKQKLIENISQKKVGLHLRLTQTISPDSGNPAHEIEADFKKITYSSI